MFTVNQENFPNLLKAFNSWTHLEQALVYIFEKEYYQEAVICENILAISTPEDIASVAPIAPGEPYQDPHEDLFLLKAVYYWISMNFIEGIPVYENS